MALSPVLCGCGHSAASDITVVHVVPDGYRGLLEISVDPTKPSAMSETEPGVFTITYTDDGKAVISDPTVLTKLHVNEAQYVDGQNISVSPDIPVSPDAGEIRFFPLTGFDSDGKSYSIVGTVKEAKDLAKDFWKNR